jgi:hypothetical protein
VLVSPAKLHNRINIQMKWRAHGMPSGHCRNGCVVVFGHWWNHRQLFLNDVFRMGFPAQQIFLYPLGLVGVAAINIRVDDRPLVQR